MQMNIAKIQSVLKNMPDQQLMQMLKRPDKIPSMFIQQEMKRRQQMRLASEAKSKGLGIKPQEVPPMPQTQRPPMEAVGMQDGGNWFNNLVSNWKQGRIGAWHPEWKSLDQKTKDAVVEAANNDVDVRSPVTNNPVTSAMPPSQVGTSQPVTSSYIDTNLMPNTTEANKETIEQNAVRGGGVPSISMPNWLKNFNFSRGLRGDESSQWTKIKKQVDEMNNQNNQTNTNNNQNLVEVKPPQGQGGIYNINKKDNDVTKEENKKVDSPKQKFERKITVPDITLDWDNTLAGQIGSDVGKTINSVNEVTKGAQESLQKGITSVSASHKKALDQINKSANAMIWTNDELKGLKTQNKKFYDEAFKFMSNDESIVDAQKKLINAMSPQATASNKFFMHLAQVGARIAGSDKPTFAQAAGEALDKTLSEVKIDNEAEREKFIEQARLGIELEEKRRANRIEALNFKSNYLNQSMEEVRKDIDAQNNIEKGKIEAAFKTGEISMQAQNVLGNMTTSIANLGINQINALGNIIDKELTRADNRTVAESNLKLELQKLAEGTADMKLFEFYRSLDEEGKGMFKEVMGLGKTANNSTVYSTMMTTITKQIEDLRGGMIGKLDDATQSQIDILNAQLDQIKQKFGLDVGSSQGAGGSGQNYMTEEDF